MKGKSLSRAQLLATPWTAAHQALPSMGFSRQEYWSGVPLPSPEGLVSQQQKSSVSRVCLCAPPSQNHFLSLYPHSFFHPCLARSRGPEGGHPLKASQGCVSENPRLGASRLVGGCFGAGGEVRGYAGVCPVGTMRHACASLPPVCFLGGLI